MPELKPKETEWKWRYTFMTGIMYGPIPVGLILVAVALLAYLIYVLTK